MSYRNLEIWKLAREQSIEIHKMTMILSKYEMYEEGQQIRRSAKSVRSNIVEGYGRKAYPKEYLRYIVFALASNDETIDHLETLFETGSLNDEVLYNHLHKNVVRLGVKSTISTRLYSVTLMNRKQNFDKPVCRQGGSVQAYKQP